METYQVVLSPSTSWTRVLVSQGPDELLRAILPPSSRMRHERAVVTFLEGLSLWLDETLPVVLWTPGKPASASASPTSWASARGPSTTASRWRSAGVAAGAAHGYAAWATSATCASFT